MRVVGGTYRELVTVPDSDDLAGSGLRAAAALREATERPVLHTAVDDRQWEEAELVASALDVVREAVGRSEPVGFSYFTPLSSPRINGPNARLSESIIVDGETVLAFGLIESGDVGVRARTVVLDPQKPRDGGPLDRQGIAADRLIVVANRGEVRRLGGDADEQEAAEALLRQGVHAVITKRAAAGCTVSHEVNDTIQHIDVGAHPTARVWPIGSGDVFSAGVAHVLHVGGDVVDAARVGSAAAAHWCSTRVPAVPAAVLAGKTSGLPAALPPTRPLVYLAGPFFTVPDRWLVEELRNTLESLGVDVFSPLHDVGEGGDDVAVADLDGLARCDAVLALLDGADAGTIFEVGWAVREGIAVVGYAKVLDREVTKMMAGTAVELHRDLSTACYRAAWAGMGLRTVPGWAQ